MACDAPMLPLDNPEVVMMARKRVAAQMARKRTQLAAVGLVVGFGVSAVICLALGLPLVDAGLKFGQYGSYLVSIGLVLTVVWWFITWRLLTSPSDTAPVGELLRRLRIEPLCRHVTAEGRR